LAQVLGWQFQAARELGDRAAEAWSLHQSGTRGLCLEDGSTAQTDLSEALRIRESLGDWAGAAVTRHNLEVFFGGPGGGSSGPQGNGSGGGGGGGARPIPRLAPWQWLIAVVAALVTLGLSSSALFGVPVPLGSNNSQEPAAVQWVPEPVAQLLQNSGDSGNPDGGSGADDVAQALNFSDAKSLAEYLGLKGGKDELAQALKDSNDLQNLATSLGFSTPERLATYLGLDDKDELARSLRVPGELNKLAQSVGLASSEALAERLGVEKRKLVQGLQGSENSEELAQSLGLENSEEFAERLGVEKGELSTLVKSATTDKVKSTTDESNKPPTDESKKPPTDESKKPPTDESNKPPTDESNKPPTDESNKPPTDESLDPRLANGSVDYGVCSGCQKEPTFVPPR
jgi:hypothetical protein